MTTSARNKKYKMFMDQLGLCWLCYKPMHLEYSCQDDMFATFDHILRKKDGGTRHLNNVLLAHKGCNTLRA